MDMGKPQRITRRTVLRSAGAVISLPFLEAMAQGQSSSESNQPARMIFMYLPFGANMDTWNPATTGKNYEISSTLKPLSPFRQDMSVLSGLQHIRGQDGGHRGVDLWLTGAKLRTPNGDYRNTQSIDQLAADHIGNTYFNSLVLSAKEGVGNPYCSHTLSFNHLGAPIPAQSKPAEIFARLFPPHRQASRKDIIARFQHKRSVLDMALEEAHSLKRKLGRQDQTRLNEYLESVRSVEKRVQVKQAIASRAPVPLPEGVEAPPSNQMPNATVWTETMLDLIVLALQTDLTRVATFATGIDDPHNGGLPVEWPEFQEVFKLTGKAKDRHGVAHCAKSCGKKGIDGTLAQTKMDTFWTERFAYLLKRLKGIPVEGGALLDHTMALYGSSQSKTHSMTNMPIVLAGGGSLGLKHGQHLAYAQGQVPLSNLFLTMLQQGRMDVERFGESTGTLTGLT